MHVNFLEPQYPYQGPRRKKMMIIIFLCLIVGSFFAGTTWVGAKVFSRSDAPATIPKVEQIDTKTFIGKVKSLFAASTRPSLGANDRINIALLGIGGEGHDGGQLTDTILIVSIKPSTKEVAMISIPRDTVVKIPGFGYRKINEANALAEMENPGSGPEVATETLQDFLDIDIPYYALVDFGGFEKIIDDIGGVDVYVDKPFTDMSFPTWDYKVRTLTFSKGWAHFDGARALDFARSRHGNNFEGSDFARSHRQQKILVAARDKFLSTDTLLHPTRLTDILTTLDAHIKTNLGLPEMLELSQIAKDLNSDKIISITFSDDPASVLYADSTTGAFYLRPKDGTLKQIQNIAQNIFTPEVADSAKTLIDQSPLKPQQMSDTKIEIQNGTWRPGFAARQKKKVEQLGYKVTSVGNAAVRPITNAQIYAVTSKNPEILEKLTKLYNAQVLTVRPPVSPDDNPQTPPQVDIIVILGENNADIAE